MIKRRSVFILLFVFYLTLMPVVQAYTDTTTDSDFEEITISVVENETLISDSDGDTNSQPAQDVPADENPTLASSGLAARTRTPGGCEQIMNK